MERSQPKGEKLCKPTKGR